MRDPYEVLGIERKASAGDIKSAYRKLAKKLHPDANKNDPKAATLFSELNAAHELLADEDKRKAFDRGEIDAEGKPRFQGYGGHGGGPRPGAGSGPGFGPDANFESFNFGPEGFTRGARRGGAAGGGGGFGGFEDILKEAFGRGARGGGAQNFEPEDFGIGADVQATMTVTLPEAARGTTERLRLPTGKELDVKIPAGIHEGQQIRLKNQGMPGQGGPGDVLITVSIAPHPVFTLEGADVRLDLPITLYEAALGGKVRVPTLDKPLELTIPPWTNSGRTFRLKGKGYPAKTGRGDLLATVRIALPEKSDSELDELMKKWQGEKPYDPRKDM
ncbi:MAG TPA: DnaJ C-terminal domain-containing protein [Xanthobacteraceae bacterium]|jgi:DnaJ-class molecular chaperone|nr:DnaJ C-terminal domain-containing protein [Xanthobacteraceae bacterium]